MTGEPGELARMRFPAIGFFIASLFIVMASAIALHVGRAYIDMPPWIAEPTQVGFFVVAPAAGALSILWFCLRRIRLSTRLLQKLARHRGKLALAGLVALAVSVAQWVVLAREVVFYGLWWNLP